MKILKETLWDRLFNRMPSNDASAYARSLKRAGKVQIMDYLDIKAMSEMVDDYRHKTHKAINDYRRWQVQNSAYALAETVRRREGALLRKRALDTASLYWDAKRDYKDIIHLALQPYQQSAANED